MRARRAEEAFFKALMAGSLALVLGALATILAVVVVRGSRGLTLEFLTAAPTGGYYLGGAGGMANAIVGSLGLASLGTALAVLLGLPVAVGLQRGWAPPGLARATRVALDVLAATPSIVYGAFGFVVMLALGLHASLLAGACTLALLMFPIAVRGMDEALRAIPPELPEVACAMGATRLETALGVTLRQALPGCVTAVVLAVGRGLGDAASLLFTAGWSDAVPRGLLDPAPSLPLAVFFQLATPFPKVQDRAFAAALVLLLLVVTANLAARAFGRLSARHRVG